MTQGNEPEDKSRAKVFFDRAHTVTDTGNYEFAIQMFMEGFARDPGNLEEFDALYRMALTRKFKGGKPAGGLMGKKLPFKGKSAKDQMLNAMFLMAHDPGDRTVMMDLMRQAVAGGYRPIAERIGPILITANSTNKSPRKSVYMEVGEIYEQLERYDDAVAVIQLAQELTPNDMDLQTQIKNLSAQAVMRKGYDNAKDFKDILKDKDETKKLMQEDNLQKSEDFRRRAVAESKAAYEKDPLNHQTITKYASALTAMDEEANENEAIRVLTEAHKATHVYQYKMEIGNLRIKQVSRNIRVLKQAIEQDPDDAELKTHLKEQREALLQLEIAEWHERAENFPTDLRTQYEYARILYRAKRFDEAIPILQQAQNNPRYRSESLHMLGRAFYESGLKPEAVEILRRAIDSYEMAEMGDKLSLEFHYWFARALEETGNTAEAIKIYSKMTQWNFSYMDVRDRLKALRESPPATPPA